MRALFDVTHPSLVHFFDAPMRALADRGHDVAVAAREKDVTTDLLDAAGVPYEVASRAGDGPLSRLAEFAERGVALLRVARRFRPDVVVSQVDPAAVHVARLVGARSVVFDDSEPARVAASVTHPFADVVCTPANLDREVPNQRRYDGYHELAYLHPERFTPDGDALREHGVGKTTKSSSPARQSTPCSEDVDPEEPYAVVRFVSWDAHHDVGREGFSAAGKRRLVESLAEHATVYASCEGELPAGVDADPLPVPPERIHDLLAFADVYVGDSQTMATEAAVLGTPAVRSNSFAGDGDMSNFVELEEYGLLESFADEDAAIERATELVQSPPREALARRRDRLLEDKVDVASFVVDVVEGEA